jgi:hypothetical protein
MEIAAKKDVKFQKSFPPLMWKNKEVANSITQMRGAYGSILGSTQCIRQYQMQPQSFQVQTNASKRVPANVNISPNKTVDTPT